MAERFTLAEVLKAEEGPKQDAKKSFRLSEVVAQPYPVRPEQASAMNVLDAVTFGFGDEIVTNLGKASQAIGLDKVAATLQSLPESIRNNVAANPLFAAQNLAAQVGTKTIGTDRDRYRATVDQFRKDYPKTALLGTVSGSMAGPAGAASLAQKSPYMAAAATGLIQGILSGAGEAPEMSDVPKAAGTQGAFGMAAAPFFMGMAKSAGAVGNAVLPKILPGKLGEMYAERLARNRIATALQRDSTDAAEVGKNMAGLGAEARVADAAGENTRTLLDLNANLPGKTQQNLESTIRNRIANRPERLDPAVYAVNGGYGRAGEVSAALAKQKAAEASPLYDEAYKFTVTPNQNLAGILQSAKKLGAFAEAEKIAEASQKKFTLNGVKLPERVQVGVDSMTNTPIFKVTEATPLSMRDLDLAKRGIDTLIERETDKVTGKVSTLGAAYMNLKRGLLAELDAATVNPQTGQSAYQAARNAFAGPAALETAITKGRAFWREDAESLATMMAGMSKSEQDAFRIGASEALRQQFGNQAGQNRFLNAWKDRNVREKLQALLGDEVKYSDVMKMLKSEETLKRMESLGPSRNSRTFSREAAAEDQALGVAGDLAALGVSAKTGSIPGMIAGVKNFTNRISTPEEVRDEIGRILLSQYSTKELNALREAQEALRRQQKMGAKAAGTAGGRTDPPGLLKGLFE